MTVDWAAVARVRASIPPSPPPDATVHAARAAIDADPAAPLDLDDLARTAGYAKHHFVRRFAHVVGQTPGRYQTRKRMELARRLLEETDLSVTDVCYRVGYASLGSFSDAFRQAHGRPPSGWRARRAALGPLREATAPVPSCFMRRHLDPEVVRNLGEAVRTAGP